VSPRTYRLASAPSAPDDFVFATASGTAISQRNVGRAFSRIVDRSGLKGVTPHALRHTFASILIAQGRDPVFVADELSHANSPITLRVYSHLFRAVQQEGEAREQLEASFGRLLRNTNDVRAIA